jgi:hypothetical protein
MYRHSALSNVQPTHDDREVRVVHAMRRVLWGIDRRAVKSPRLDIMQRINRPVYPNNIVE